MGPWPADPIRAFDGDGFRGEVAMIPEALRARMHGSSWHPDPRCPAMDALSLLSVRHWNFSAEVVVGQAVVAAALADDLLAIFKDLFAAGFPIERMEPIDLYRGNDDESMAANNTSVFNFRNVAGTHTLSKHALGMAIDINPVMNPMLVDGAVHPPAGVAYLDRAAVRPGMIVRPGSVVEAFEARGWQWGGDWAPMKDYHHFYKASGH